MLSRRVATVCRELGRTAVVLIPMTFTSRCAGATSATTWVDVSWRTGTRGEQAGACRPRIVHPTDGAKMKTASTLKSVAACASLLLASCSVDGIKASSPVASAQHAKSLIDIHDTASSGSGWPANFRARMLLVSRLAVLMCFLRSEGRWTSTVESRNMHFSDD